VRIKAKVGRVRQDVHSTIIVLRAYILIVIVS